MPGLEVEKPPETPETNNAEGPSTQAVVGIIYPPPEVRSMLLKINAFLILYKRK